MIKVMAYLETLKSQKENISVDCTNYWPHGGHRYQAMVKTYCSSRDRKKFLHALLSCEIRRSLESDSFTGLDITLHFTEPQLREAEEHV